MNNSNADMSFNNNNSTYNRNHNNNNNNDEGDDIAGAGFADDQSNLSPRPTAREDDAPPREDTFHVLYNYMLRNESGIALNLWDGDATFAVLQMFCKSVHAGARVREAGKTMSVCKRTFFEASFCLSLRLKIS